MREENASDFDIVDTGEPCASCDGKGRVFLASIDQDDDCGLCGGSGKLRVMRAALERAREPHGIS